MIVAFCGNPNVGKSTIFNSLTGLRQHTGNWAGKTVETAWGECEFESTRLTLVDLPGTYSLAAHSKEEEVARDFIEQNKAACVVVVCDATCLMRNLNLVLQVLNITKNVVICVNLIDEAEKNNIVIDLDKLSRLTGACVVGTKARKGEGIDSLMASVVRIAKNPIDTSPNRPMHHSNIYAASTTYYPSIQEELRQEAQAAKELIYRAESIYKECVLKNSGQCFQRDRSLDKIFLGSFRGYCLMGLLLFFILWLTLVGANYPSSLLFSGLFFVEERLAQLLIGVNAPNWVSSLFVFGIYRVLAWVVAVMLPPMAIFFPLFTFLEDVGYLPRIAYNMDKFFKGCSACGKQALTMWLWKYML